MFRKFFFVYIIVLFLCGCQSFRYPATEVQKQNAYLHSRATEMASALAVSEASSKQLKKLTNLSALQSRGFVADYGLPKVLPNAHTVGDVLDEASYAVADAAFDRSQKKPDAWDIADGAIDAGIAIAGLLGGVWGIKAAGFLRVARQNSNALREVVLGNEVFKKTNAENADAFKSAHSYQSQPTKRIVADMKL